MEEKNKRTNQDKFMIRMQDTVHAGMTEQALLHRRSVNSEICHAVDQWRDSRSEIKLVCHLLGVHVVDEKVRDPHIYTTPDIKNTMIRFTDTQLQLVREQAYIAGHSMNHQINLILQWWLQINQVLSRRLALCTTPR